MSADKYFSGEALYGDDFTLEQIKQWYNDEAEAYADLGSKDGDSYEYFYDELNKQHGFKYLGNAQFDKALGLGAAYGHEYFPIINRIKELHILEPSDNLQSEFIGTIKPIYKKPAVDGAVDYPDDTFNLITSFGTLHHVPNVTHVIKELYRVTKPGGYLLLREPVISMGDWRQPRKGLTKHERGIPLNIFRGTFKELGAEVVNESFCFCMTAFFQRTWSKFFKKPIFRSAAYIAFDKALSRLTTWNLHYHATGKLQRIAPQSVFYVLRKPVK